MTKLKLRIVTPDQLIYEGEVQCISAIGPDGIFSVLPNHAPMLATLAKGEIKIEEDEKKTFYVMVESGVLDVSANEVNILTQVAMMAEEANMAQMKMEFEKHQRDERNLIAREHMVESELKLRRLIRKVSDYDSR
jgi:F-type H+-transporting ATPase subunit epsilon